MQRLYTLLLLALPAAGQDVPLELWTNTTWPNGLPVGGTNGVSWGDYDADGWPDFFAARSGRLWHNLEGQDWEVMSIIPGATRYGSSFGDYNQDGLPDIATAPRVASGELMKLLKNLGNGIFDDVGDDPAIVDVPPKDDSETICWADVDFDGDLDCFVPVYPPWAMGGGLGNYFLRNEGPTGPGGAFRFTEQSASAGVDNPPGSARPEGAQFMDIDGDGDLDLFSNNHLYVNVSKPGEPRFVTLVEAESGIKNQTQYDEGLAFKDYDLDGDMDLLIAYCGGPGVRVYENRGDGHFKIAPSDIIANNQSGLCLGLSVADWDNDGDWDLTTRWQFRRNMLMETGSRGFVVATHNIPADHISSATPAWADWDKDGDLDCSLGNWTSVGHFYENTLYDEATPKDERRYVRVRVMTDDPALADGRETEYGACVELTIHGDRSGLRRRQFVTSAGGYLNQDEYVLHFALPADPFPADPHEDLRFDVSVVFPSDPSKVRVVDRFVNPELGSIHLADLEDRELVVFRGGRVEVDGCRFQPALGQGRDVTTTTGGLILPRPGAPLVDPVVAPAANWYVGHEFDTSLATGPLRIKEVVLDGRLDADATACVGEQRVALWDVTDPMNVTLQASAKLTRVVRNDRVAHPVDFLVAPGRVYRLVACVDRLRGTPVAAPVVDGAVVSLGGLSYADPTPCEPTEVLAAAVDATQVFLSLRFAEDSGVLWADLGHALAGATGKANLRGSGVATPNQPVTLSLTGAPANTPTVLVVGETALCRPLAGGLLVPSVDTLLPVTTDANGGWTQGVTVPAGFLPGETLYFQCWWLDAGGPQGRAASNALSVTGS